MRIGRPLRNNATNHCLRRRQLEAWLLRRRAPYVFRYDGGNNNVSAQVVCVQQYERNRVVYLGVGACALAFSVHRTKPTQRPSARAFYAFCTILNIVYTKPSHDNAGPARKCLPRNRRRQRPRKRLTVCACSWGWRSRNTQPSRSVRDHIEGKGWLAFTAVL